MSATAPPPVREAARPVLPSASPASASAAPGPRREQRRAAISPLWLLAVAAFAVWAALQWSRLLAEPPADRGLLALLVVAFGVLLLQRVRLPRRVVVGLGLVAVLVLALLVSGVPLRMLAPRGWDELTAGLGAGLEPLPTLEAPYAGDEAWVRRILVIGGMLLGALGLALSLSRHARSARPAGRMLAALPFVVMCTVPAVSIPNGGELWHGWVLLAVLAGVAWLDRLAFAGFAAAGVLAAIGLSTAALLAPVLDTDEPWIAYEDIAQSLSDEAAVFDWTLDYGPLDWPRVGREVLRVSASPPVYVKAENLDQFDGRNWRAGPSSRVLDTAREVPESVNRGRWTQEIDVEVSGVTSRELFGAGTTLRVTEAPHPVLPGLSPGTFRSAEPLQPGDDYKAVVYTPRPGRAAMRKAGTDYEPWLDSYLGLALAPPGPRGSLPVPTVQFPTFGSGEFPAVRVPGGGIVTGDAGVQQSVYGRVYRLSQRLLAESGSPYEYVRRVEKFLAKGFEYDEDPPAADVPLDAFLFRDRLGYCQQFSGSMAMLLRMGGVPARVAAGFSPGRPDSERRDRIIRDTDAHSWVEAWFPGLGWVIFDPTPPDAPALSGGATVGPSIRPGDLPAVPRRPGPASSGFEVPEAGSSGNTPWAWIVVGVVALGGAGVAVVRFRRRPRRTPVEELGEALRRTGRRSRPGQTLSELESRLSGRPEAAGYVAALRAERFGWPGTSRATSRGRAAVRAELARGLGWRGRLRAFRALPPRLH